ncbi:MAG: chloride channel protein [Collinsella sp.]|nr:chloride channel protein [Collinsella sp.]
MYRIDDDRTLGRRTAKVLVATLASCGLGAVLGFALWALLSLAYGLTELIWGSVASSEAPRIMALAICICGGLALGWWNRRFQSSPRPFHEVLSMARQDGSFLLDRPFATLVSFLLPLSCGAPVGPEAGLTGFAADGCTRIGRVLRKVVGSRDDGSIALAKAERAFVYGLGIVGGGLGIWIFSLLFEGAGLPRLPIPEFSVESVLWVPALTVAGMALSWLLRRFQVLASKISEHFGGRDVFRAVACGIIIAVVAAFLPYTLFPGTEQLSGLMETWDQMGTAELVLTSVFKLALLALCLEMGWRGGPFFPLIFSAACLGLGFSAVFGIDPNVSMIVVASSLLGRFTRKLPFALFIAVTFIPIRALPWAMVPLAAGCVLPTVEELAIRRRGSGRRDGAGYPMPS